MHTSYEDEKPGRGDRRKERDADLRRLLDLSSKLANMLEILTDPAIRTQDLRPCMPAVGLVSMYRRELRRFQDRNSRALIARIKVGAPGCTVSGCPSLEFK